jgi:hypothetical protein
MIGVTCVEMGAEGICPCIDEVIPAEVMTVGGFGADGIKPGARNVEGIGVGRGCDGIILVGRNSDGIKSAGSSSGTTGAEGMMFRLLPVQGGRR